MKYSDEVINLQTKIRNIFKETRRDKDFQPEIFQSAEDSYMTKSDCELLLKISGEFSACIENASFPKGEYFENDREELMGMARVFQEAVRKYMEAE